MGGFSFVFLHSATILKIEYSDINGNLSHVTKVAYHGSSLESKRTKCFERKSMNIFLSVSLKYVWVLKRTVILSTHNIYFLLRNKKYIF